MLLILIFNVIFIGLFAASKLSPKDSVLKGILKGAAWIAAGVFIFLCVSAVKVNLEKDTLEAQWSERYDALYAQAYYKMYSSDSAKKELADQIMEWNIDYQSYWTKKDNIWISCFYPIRIDNYRAIPIELIGIKEEGVG